MKNSEWTVYNDLAWTERILCPPRESAEEPEAVASYLKRGSGDPVRNLLHLGCGAGTYDYWLKKVFNVTGIDISEGMLNEARKLNPEIPYQLGDMRDFELGKQFDAVIVPDAIDYMRTPDDLEQLFRSVERHLKFNGLFLIVANTREEFRENNFVYSGINDRYHITVFENNHFTAPDRSGYEAAITYLIRDKGKLSFVNEKHELGLFEKAAWLSLFQRHGFDVSEERMDDIYDAYLMEEGEYCQTVFIGQKIR